MDTSSHCSSGCFTWVVGRGHQGQPAVVMILHHLPTSPPQQGSLRAVGFFLLWAAGPGTAEGQKVFGGR